MSATYYPWNKILKANAIFLTWNQSFDQSIVKYSFISNSENDIYVSILLLCNIEILLWVKTLSYPTLTIRIRKTYGYIHR